MTHRVIQGNAGTRLVMDFNPLKYAATPGWSVSEKAGTNVLAADVSSAKFCLKERLGTPDASAKVTKTNSSGITLSNGSAKVTLSPTDTKDLQGTYYGTLRLYLADGGVSDAEDTSYLDVPYIEVDFSQGAVEAVS